MLQVGLPSSDLAARKSYSRFRKGLRLSGTLPRLTLGLHLGCCSREGTLGHLFKRCRYGIWEVDTGDLDLVLRTSGKV